MACDYEFCIPKRWRLALLANIGFILALGARCNFGGIRSMHDGNITEVEVPKILEASPEAFGMIQGSFYLGYVVMHLPAAFSVAWVGAHIIFGVCVGSSCVLALSLMLSLRVVSAWPAMVVTFMQGSLQGFIYPAMHQMWHYWAPPSERSRLTTTTFVGAYLGVAFGMPVTEILAFSVHWMAPFITYGALGAVWMIVWLHQIRLKPSTDTRISDNERKYIESSIGPVSPVQVTVHNTPWCRIFKSMPVWAIVVSNFARCWTMFLLVQHQLTYMKLALKLDGLEIGYGLFPYTPVTLHLARVVPAGCVPTMAGIFSMFPHIIMSVTVIAGGQLADYLICKKFLSTTHVRKLMNILGFGSEAALLIALSFAEGPTSSLILIICAVSISGFAISGFNVNHLDIAPRYAATLMSLSNGLGATAGIVCPMVTELLMSTFGQTRGWRYVFLSAAAVHCTGVIFYTAFASGEQQKWAEPDASVPLTKENCDDKVTQC